MVAGMLEKHYPAAMFTIYLGMLLKKWQSLKIKGSLWSS